MKVDRIPGVCVSVCVCAHASPSLTMAAMVCSSFSTKSTFLAEVSDASTPLWPRQDSLALSYVSFAVKNFRQEFPTRCQLSPHTFSGGRKTEMEGETKEHVKEEREMEDADRGRRKRRSRREKIEKRRRRRRRKQKKRRKQKGGASGKREDKKEAGTVGGGKIAEEKGRGENGG